MGYKSSMKNWEGLAQQDALWSILTDKKRKGAKWDKEQFFKSGQQEVDGIFNFLKAEDISPLDYDHALDFGSGAGRISRALLQHFTQVTGVDASPTMIQLATHENQDYQQLRFVLNQKEDLSQFPDNSFSAAFSVITLQHIPAHQSAHFISEFIRVTKPGGLAVFQVPTRDVRQLSVVQRLKTFLRIRERLALLGIGKGFNMDMHPVAEDRVQQLVQQSGGTIELAVNTNQTEPDYNGEVQFLPDGQAASGYISRLFVVRKR